VNKAEVEDDKARIGPRVGAHEQVRGLQIAMYQSEIVEKGERAEYFGDKAWKSLRSLTPHGLDEVVAVNELEYETGMSGARVQIELVDSHEVWVAECG